MSIYNKGITPSSHKLAAKAKAKAAESFRSKVAAIKPVTYGLEETWTDNQAERAIVTLNALIREAKDAQ